MEEPNPCDEHLCSSGKECFIDKENRPICKKIRRNSLRIPIQTFTIHNDREQEVIAALNFTVTQINSAIHTPFLIAHKNKALKQAVGDTWGVMKKICDELEEGFVMMITGDNSRIHEAFRTVSNSFEIPLINWDLFLPSLLENFANNYEVSVKPPNAELIADLIVLKNWKNFIYMHDGQSTGAVNLGLIYKHLKKKSKESVTSELIELPKEVEGFAEFLTDTSFNSFMKNTVNRIVLDVETSYRQKQLLNAIRSAQFNQANYHYVVANFDFQPYDIEMFQSGNTNITGFQIINREVKEFSLLQRAVGQSKHLDREKHMDLETRLAFVHDAILVAQQALELTLKKNDSLFHHNFRYGKLYNRGLPGIYCNPANDKRNPDRQVETFEHGKFIIEKLKNMKLSTENGTLTGTIEFDEFGIRKNYHVNVIDLVSDSESLNRKEVFSWKQGKGFVMNRTAIQHTRKPREDSSVRKKMRVVVVLIEPFVMVKRDCENSNSTACMGNNRFEGYCISLLKLLKERIEGFDYEIFLSERNRYGTKQPNGSWDGMIGYLLRGEAEFAVAPFSVNQASFMEREEVVDFSTPYMTTGISIMIKKPDKKEFSIYSFMQPFKNEIWIYIIFSYVGVSVVIFLVSRFSPYAWKVEEVGNEGLTLSTEFSMYNCFWFTLAALMQQGTDIFPRSLGGRIASGVWWFFTMIIVSSYIANLVILSTISHTYIPVESVDDLVKQARIKYGVQQGGSTAQFFKNSPLEIYQRMWGFMEAQDPSVFTSSYAEGIERVRMENGEYAFILEDTANEYVNTRLPCDTMKVGANLNLISYSIATPFGSEWKEKINIAILDLKNSGELGKLKEHWWYDRGQCNQRTSEGSTMGLDLSRIGGIFHILIGGMIVSISVTLVEFICRSGIEARKEKISSMKELKEFVCNQLKPTLRGTRAREASNFKETSSLLPATHGSSNPLSVPTTSAGTTS
ncbi:hypothetical protein FO519_003811 [Halicephalobus sp. NKZ332]|nr:hypothetical protein FO519_003811 [Halicephalobus sp. NKZ332]